MDHHQYSFVGQIRGLLSQQHSPDPEAFERVNYLQAVVSFNED